MLYNFALGNWMRNLSVSFKILTNHSNKRLLSSVYSFVYRIGSAKKVFASADLFLKRVNSRHLFLCFRQLKQLTLNKSSLKQLPLVRFDPRRYTNCTNSHCQWPCWPFELKSELFLTCVQTFWNDELGD